MEFDEIVVKESPGLCRCCLSEGCYKDLGSEYTWMNEAEVYADMLLECFDISITQHNEGPNGPSRLICEVCITRLRDACNFKKQVLDSEKKFIDMLGRGEFRPKVLIYQTQMKTENSDEQVQEEVEYLEDDLDFDDDEVLKPSVDEHSSSPLETVTSETISLKRKLKTKKTKISRPKKHVEVDEKPKSSKAVSKDEETTSPLGGYTSELRRKNLKLLYNNTTVMPFKWRGKYLCFFCGKSCTEYVDFKKHTKSHGHCSTKDYSLKSIKGCHIEIKIDVSEIVCKICTEPFNHYEEIIDHLIGKHSIDYDRNIDMSYQAYRLIDFKCLYCEEQFSYFGYLVNHVNTTHPQKSFICNDCGLSFNKKRDLTLHLRSYHREGGYPCDQCLQNFENYYLLKRHKNNTHFRQCNNCGFKFASLSMLQKHIKLDHSSNDFTCKFCSKEFNSLQGLSKHTSKCTVRKLSLTESIPSDLPELKKKQNLLRIRQNIQCVLNMSTATPFKFFSQYTCFYCSKKFVEFEDLKQHTVSEHPVCELKAKCMRKCKGERVCVKIDVATLSCKICCVPFLDLNGFIDHAVKDHKADYDKSIINCLEPFRIVKDNIPCPICPEKTFRYFNILQRHLNSDHSDNNKICDFCGKTFRNVANLKVHLSYTHTGSCECDVCGVKYKNQLCLARHKARTHNAKDFKCEKCSEVFKSQYQRQKHMIKIHDIGHRCNYCGKMFTRNSFMKDHIRRTHLKEKNVPCSVCNERFFDNYLLRMHMVKHDGERKFTCEVCGKAFLRKSNLSSHKEMHKKYGHVQAQS